MRHISEQVLHWAPRVLGFLFAVFVSLFALDVFGEGYSFWETVVAFTMHMIPTALILIALAVSWRWGWAGGLIFIGLGVWYVVWAGGRLHWSAYAVIAGPLFLLGILFEIDWWYRKLQSRSKLGSPS